MQMHLFPFSRAKAAMATGTLPNGVERSVAPSPVMIRSASWCPLAQVGRLDDDVGAHHQLAASATGRRHAASARYRATPEYPREATVESIWQSATAPIQFADHSRRCTFLGTKDAGSALGAAQRIVDITRHLNFHFLQARVQMVAVQIRDQQHILRSGAQFIAVFVKELHAQRFHHAHATLIGGGTADADDDLLTSARPMRP